MTGDLQRDGVPASQAITSAVAELVPLLIPDASYDVPTATVTITTGTRRATFSVRALLTASAAPERHDIEALIEAWCATVLDRLAEPQPPLRVDHLRTRLLPRRDVDPVRQIIKRYGSYFQLELMADLGHRRRWVTPDDVAALGLGPDEAIGTGLRTTLLVEWSAVRQSSVDRAPGPPVMVASADGNPWVASGLVAAAELFGFGEQRAGAIVAVPRSGAVLCRVVESARVIAELGWLGRLVADLHRTAAPVERCSPGLFWAVAGALYPIVGADSQRVRLPVELEPLVRSLPTETPAERAVRWVSDVRRRRSLDLSVPLLSDRRRPPQIGC